MMISPFEPTTLPSPDRRRADGQAGFTLVELLVVLAIIALLATLIGPKVLGYLGGARRDTVQMQIRNLSSAVDLYYLSTGTYPTPDQGLSALVDAPAGQAGWSGPYIQSRSALTDPWGHAYVYSQAGTGYVISSLGRDGKPGGEGEDADITSDTP
ncbi:type II secretion system major pseudopilin GspG [Rhizobium sp. RU20A]|uniref:type II secretion system major pseudopilin GspG n=1 Tax=Rhizobium sp. RU20A TaxID=1907412 RepID=UPI00122D00EE|nr:type II secretion system major pseudopilin GspG [Rhizobium sp. RU20A]